MPKSTHHTATLAGDLRVVLGQLTRRLRQEGEMGELTRSQTSVLSRLEREGPATTSDLARSEGIRPQSMSAIVTVLKDAGLVTGAAHPDDGRKVVLSLTPLAAEQFASGRRAREDWLLKAIGAELSSTELGDLSRCVGLLRRLNTYP